MNKYQQILTKYWGYTHFRPLQEDIIRSVDSGKDTLGLMTTGGGKSITFQVASLSKPGVCLVITPLISLMKDQVDLLNHKQIKAHSIHSGLHKDEVNIILDNCSYGDFKFLYISPERIGSEIFRSKVRNLPVNLIAVDEAHCISQWGYDFRPSYLNIAELKNYFPDVPILALTATATSIVIDDIQEKLLFKEKNVFKTSFKRDNLSYLVRNEEDKTKYLLTILSRVKGSGIIYVRSRKKTKEISALLNKNNISSSYYHAGLKNEIRNQRQTDWKNDKTRVMVATNAFGMGIDKPNVRFVIHVDAPDSLEAYFQEAGRAGRDEQKAYAVLLFNKMDVIQAEKRVASNFPDIESIKNCYQALGNYLKVPLGSGKNNVYDFNIVDFSANYSFNIIQAYNSLKFLEKEGYIELTDEIDNPSRIRFIVNRDDLYKFQVANASLDGFIKLILRSYTGLFSDYTKIDEFTLAKRAKINQELVYEYLLKLSKFKIINYIPRKKTPLLVYTEERLDDKNLRISSENYTIRKQRYIERMNAVLDYAGSQTKCRSQILLEYFGEKNSHRCGQCDVCTKRNELDMSKYEFDDILDELKKKLAEGPAELDTLVASVKRSMDKTIKVIQWLLDNSKIIYNEGNWLEWNKK